MAAPLVLNWGGGLNSTAMMVGFWERGIRPDLVIYSDTGGEKPETYALMEEVETWMHTVRFPELTKVTNVRPELGHTSLENECHNNKTLPSIVFGFRGCSAKWKRQPIERWEKRWRPATTAWEEGLKVRKAIGYDLGEERRAKIPSDGKYVYEYPLIEWLWGRSECADACKRVGLPVPVKSACWFCPASTKHEVRWLARAHPDLFERAVAMEHNAADALRNVKGLGRHWSWEEVAKADENQLQMFTDMMETPCFCADGGE